MAYELDSQKAGEEFLVVAKHLRQKYGNEITITLGDMSFTVNNKREGHYISATRISSDNSAYRGSHETRKEFYSAVDNLFKQQYFKLTSLCIDTIGKELFVKQDKEYVPFICESINKDGIASEEGNTYNIEHVYIKG